LGTIPRSNGAAIDDSPQAMPVTAIAAALVLFAFGGAAGDGAPRASVLSDGWVFQPDPLGVGDAQHWHDPAFDRSGWRRVAVPMAWDFFDPVMDGYEGVGWYALRLQADRIAAGKWQTLRFGRANHHAKVWIDGEEAGASDLGYLPFDVPATPHLKAGRDAWIVVRVENGARYHWLPGSTTVEWVQYGGLLEPVELVTTSLVRLARASIRATPRDAGGRIVVAADVASAAEVAFDGRVVVEVEGRSASAGVRVAAGASERVTLEISLPGARLWSLDSPALYDAHVRLLGPAGEIDAIAERFGVRSIETKGRQILLNGKPLRIRGVNRYDEFPGRGPVADEAAIRADLEAVKALGANFVRVHYPQSPAHLRIADEIGLLYMEEVPLNWWRAAWHPPVPKEFDDDRIVDTAERALEEMMRRDGNHPSLAIWSMANECETSDDRGTRAMERLLRRAHELDPTRPATYVANRKFTENRAFGIADLVAVNLYFGMWDGETAETLSQMEERVERPTREALESVAKAFPDKPILLSEFGTIGIPGSGGDLRFSEDYQAAYLSAVWRAVEARPDVAGGVVWSWADYRHRRGFTNDFPACFGPFGLVTLDRRPKKASAAIRALWAASAVRR
jgi:beta-galactosidase/beta-glucuronidase